MASYAGFIQAICAEPEDIGVRLIFADWLEEQREPTLNALGEFVRFQCELEPLRAHGHGVENPHRGHCDACLQLAKLERRERLLLNLQRLNLWQLVPWIPKTWTMTTHAHKTAFRVGVGERIQDIWCTLRRGFVEEIACTAHEWTEWGHRIVASTPLRKASLAGWVEGRLQWPSSGQSPAERPATLSQLYCKTWPTVEFEFLPIYGLSQLQGPAQVFFDGLDLGRATNITLPGNRPLRDTGSLRRSLR